MNKIILEEIKKVADRLWVSLKDIVFHHNPDIVFLEDNVRLEKSVDSQVSVVGQFVDWVLKTTVSVPDNYKAEKPLQFCFFLKQKEAIQRIETTFNIGKNAYLRIFSNCMTVDSIGQHDDMKYFNLEEWSRLETYELHFNTKQSATTTNTTSNIKVWKNAYYSNEFVATMWNLGNLTKNMIVELNWESSKAELLSRINLKTDDKVTSYNEINLRWSESKAMLKSKSVSHEWATNVFVWKMSGFGDNCIWHVDCEEVLLWVGDIQSLPELRVINPTARLTHEASIGSIEKSAIDNLRAKWLTQEQATDFIVKWVLD